MKGKAFFIGECMNKKNIEWLSGEIDRWCQEEIISEEQRAQLVAQYTVPPKAGPNKVRGLVLLGGGILVFLGLFLLFAGYWYGFSPNGRFDWGLAIATIALLVVAIAMGVAKPGGYGADGATTYYMVSVALSTMLIGDTYYTGAYSGIYAALVLLVSLPILYILQSRLGLVLYYVSLIGWSLLPQGVSAWTGPLPLWGFIIASLPAAWQVLSNKEAMKTELAIVMSWTLVAAMFTGLYFTVSAYDPGMELLVLSVVGTAIFVLASQSKAQAVWVLPFKGIGIAGMLYLVVVGTLIRTWIDIGEGQLGYPSVLVAILALLLTTYLMKSLWCKMEWVLLSIGILPYVIAIDYGLMYYGMSPVMTSLIFDAYVLLVAAILVGEGLIKKKVGSVNGGIVAILAMFGARFFDPSFTFVERGMSFFIIGLLVVATNAIYMWQKKRSHKIKKPRRRRAEATHEEGDNP